MTADNVHSVRPRSGHSGSRSGHSGVRPAGRRFLMDFESMWNPDHHPEHVGLLPPTLTAAETAAALWYWSESSARRHLPILAAADLVRVDRSGRATRYGPRLVLR